MWVNEHQQRQAAPAEQKVNKRGLQPWSDPGLLTRAVGSGCREGTARARGGPGRSKSGQGWPDSYMIRSSSGWRAWGTVFMGLAGSPGPALLLSHLLGLPCDPDLISFRRFSLSASILAWFCLQESRHSGIQGRILGIPRLAANS